MIRKLKHYAGVAEVWTKRPVPRLLEQLPVHSEAALVSLASTHIVIATLWLLRMKPFEFPGITFPLVSAFLIYVVFITVRRKNSQISETLTQRFGSLLIIVPVYGFFYYVLDTSWDAMRYHLPSMLRLSQGWNPLYTSTDVYWANLYPNGIWSLFALVGSLTGSLDSARILKIALLFVCFGQVWSVLSIWVPHTRYTAILAAVLILNPVVTAQIWTFYLDDIIYLLTLCCFCGSARFFRRPSWSTSIVLAASLFLLVLSKLSGVYFAGVAVVAGAVCGYRSSLYQTYFKHCLPVSIILVVAIVVSGWRPFVTNTIVYGDPILISTQHPVEMETPSNLRDLPRALTFGASMFARSGGLRQEPVRLKLPFWTTFREMYHMATPDTRAAGFGPFFSGALLLSAILYLYFLKFWRSARHNACTFQLARVCFALGFLIFTACLLFPVNWWARLVPIAWVLPVIPCICIAAFGAADRRVADLSKVILVILALNSGLAFVGNGARTVVRWWDWRTDVASISNEMGSIAIIPSSSGSTDVTVHYWLSNAGYSVRQIGAGGCQNSKVVWRGVRICNARAK